MIAKNIEKWVKTPFSPNMDLWEWGLFTAVILTAVFLWATVIKKISKT